MSESVHPGRFSSSNQGGPVSIGSDTTSSLVGQCFKSSLAHCFLTMVSLGRSSCSNRAYGGGNSLGWQRFSLVDVHFGLRLTSDGFLRLLVCEISINKDTWWPSRLCKMSLAQFSAKEVELLDQSTYWIWNRAGMHIITISTRDRCTFPT